MMLSVVLRVRVVLLVLIVGLMPGEAGLAQDAPPVPTGDHAIDAIDITELLSTVEHGDEALQRLDQAGENRAELVKAVSDAPTAAQREAVAFLIAYMPNHDLQSLSTEFLLENVALAFKARETFPWAGDIPWDVFLNDIVPYATLNERRDNWRGDFYARFAPVVAECETIPEAYEAIARQIQSITKVAYNTKRRKPDQSPYESMEQGMASCTGLSILCTDALRAVGIPSRIAGTPEWTTVPGNHNWCEVYVAGEWKFTEYGHPKLDDAWFLERASRADASQPQHRLYASSFKPTDQHFPLVWDFNIKYVHGVDVTQRYKSIHEARVRERDANKAEIAVVLREHTGGERVIREVRVLRGDKEVGKGQTRGPRDDLNNMLSFKLAPNSSFVLEFEGEDGEVVRHEVKTGEPRNHQVVNIILSKSSDRYAGSFAAWSHIFGSTIDTERTLVERLRDIDGEVMVPLDEVDATKRALWERYQREQTTDAQRLNEHEEKQIVIGDKTMRYDYSVIGDKPDNGYPLYIALHGGGGAPPRVNDGQWNHMKRYYRDSVKAGVYVATRGMTNTYNLHSVPTSYPAYDRLIENMILFEDVDPNRVYVLGFSAGGDGVYQIAPRMADRWAGVNMSAGHPNGVSLVNVFNVPFLLQMGERDAAYNRNKVAAEYSVKLDELQSQHPGGYVHEVNIHRGRPHNFADNDAQMGKREVIEDPAAWLSDGKRDAVERNTNAIAWLEQHARNPLPAKVIWELGVGAPLRSSSDVFVTANRDHLRYWLDLSGQVLGTNGTDVVIARLDRGENAVIVEKCGTYLRILLNSHMLDLSRPVAVVVGESRIEVQPRATLRNLVLTLIDRGDPSFMFEAAITLENTDDGWVVSTE